MESSLINNNASVKKCSAQASLPGSLQLYADTLVCEDAPLLTARKLHSESCGPAATEISMERPRRAQCKRVYIASFFFLFGGGD